MGKNQRQDEILKFVDRAGTVTVAEIMETMKVSDMTVRRDLIELENQGKLTRVFGGAKSNKVQQYRELPHEEKLLKILRPSELLPRKLSSLLRRETLSF